jgi:hypothetical protein
MRGYYEVEKKPAKGRREVDEVVGPLTNPRVSKVEAAKLAKKLAEKPAKRSRK